MQKEPYGDKGENKYPRKFWKFRDSIIDTPQGQRLQNKGQTQRGQVSANLRKSSHGHKNTDDHSDQPSEVTPC